jgi:hypothetical protein
VLRVALALALVLLARPAMAQCGAKRSTCSACHDGAQAVFAASEPWHEDHRFADLCVACHAGDGEAKDVASAHAGMAAPRAQCGSCHGPDRTYAVAKAPARAEPKPPPHGAPLPNTIAGILAVALAVAGGTIVVRRERGRRDEGAA